MAEQGYVLDIDAKFIERLGKADEALDKFVKSTDRLSRQFDELASGGLSRFASAIDSIVQSISQVSRVDIGDMGISSVSEVATRAVDNVVELSKAVDNISDVNAGIVHTSDFMLIDTKKLEKEVDALETAINKTERKRDEHRTKLRKLKKSEAAPSAIRDAKAAYDTDRANLSRLKKQLKEVQELLRDAEIKNKATLSNMLSSQVDEFIPIANLKASIKEIDKMIHEVPSMYPDPAEQQRVVDQLVALRGKYKQAMKSSGQKDAEYQKELEANRKIVEAAERADEAEAKSNKKKAQSIIDDYNKEVEAARKSIEARQKMYVGLWDKMEHDERTTFSGAMDYSKTTKSINDQIQAIKYLEEARNKLDKTTLGAKEYKRQVKEINNEITRQKKEVDELNDVAGKLKGMLGTMFSIGAIRGYVNQIIQVRGEFELQQRALQALLQNKAEANKLWEQTVQLAVRSPFQVKELVTYTKQLAAYRVETEKLHDTTKMLADISAGLGVDMGRLILAFGQVKAANYLRGTELRQFSEAGINILDELARYYTAVEGKIVTVGQVFERVSKRMVSFQDVEKVLQNVTSAGGMFYQMQEIQAETLKGSISNLKDQLDLMLNDIGKSNEGILKGAVQLAALLIKNYNALVPVLTTVGLAFAGMYLNTQRIQSGFRAIGKGGANLIKGLVNPWTLALAAVSEVISSIIRYRQEVSQITKEHNRLRDSLSEIELAFRDAMNKDAVDNMRNSLSQLVALAKNEFQIDLKLNDEELKSIDFSALESKFVELRDILFDSNAIAEKVKNGLASVKIWDSTFMRTLITSLTPAGLFGYEGGESMATDIKQFEKAAQDALVGIQAESKRIANELQLDVAHMLRLPQAPLETNLQYVNRLVKAYEGLRDEMEMKGLDTSEIDGYIEKLRKHTNEASRELGLFFTKYEEQIVHLSEEGKKAFINNIVNSEGWSEYTKELIYNLYNLDLERVIPKALAQFDIDQLNAPGKTTAQKDTRWENLLRTIKEANSAYKELAKTFDKATAKEGMLTKYSDALNDVLSKVAINGQKLNASQFLEMFNITTEEGMLKALDMIAEKAPDAADKLKAKLEKGEITWEARIKVKENEDKKLTDLVENLFSGYELSLELDKLNIPADFAQDFFNIEASSLESLRERLTSMKGLFVGQDMVDEYEKAMKKLDEMEDKAQRERLKTYLQYARAAVGERAKIKLEELRKLQEIELTFGDDPKFAKARQNAMTKVREESLNAMNKKEWEDFQRSDLFVSLFEDLDHASDTLIRHAIDKLEEFKEQWKDMPHEEMKSIVDNIEKLKERLGRYDNPWENIKALAEERAKDSRSDADIELNIIGNTEAIENAKKELAILETAAQLSREMNVAELANLAIATNRYELEDMTEEEFQNQIDALKTIIKNSHTIIANDEKTLGINKKIYQEKERIIQTYQQLQDAANELYNAFSDIYLLFGNDDDMAKIFADMGMSMANSVIDAIKLNEQLQNQRLQMIANGVAADAFAMKMNAAMGIIGWIVMGVQLIGTALSAAFKAHDKNLENQIVVLQEEVEILEKKLEKLEKLLDDVFSANALSAYTDAAARNIDQQIAAYERMIKLEEDKKKTDNDKIKGWRDDIEELAEQRKELYNEAFNTATNSILDDALGAAESFVDAWYEAFKETGDGLSGLKDEFTNMMSDLIKRQAAMQIVGAYTNMYKDWLKDYIDAQAGDVTLTAQEAAEWAQRVQETFPELSSALETFFNGVGGLMQEQGELSELSKGIQGVTETTAQVLEALLNSMRFYVADSNTRLRNIEALMGGGEQTQNPILNELQQHTAMLRSIESMFDSVIGRGSSTHSGAYLKVLM